MRNTNLLTTSLYRKLTFSDVFPHFESFIDDSCKKSLIFTLLFCCFSICSDFTKFHLEIEKLRDFSKRNGYPSSLIEMCICTFFQKWYVPKQADITVPKKQLLLILPFLGKIFSKLKQWVVYCFKSSLLQCEVKIIFKSTNRLSSLFTCKDVIPKHLQSNLI